jgi:HAD superfamily hydrolase (TIGR01490 family)
MKNKIAIFDFCETLVNFQSGNAFIEFCLEKTNLRYKKFLYNLYQSKYYRRFFHWQHCKKKILSLLRGFELKTLEYLAKEYALVITTQKQIHCLVEELYNKKKEGYLIWIVSGGYTIYLKYCFENMIDQVIATDIVFEEKICKGEIKGIDCMGENKILKMKQKSLLKKIDKKQAVVYSDSPSDLPLFRLADQCFVVSRRPQKWAKDYNFEEIIW